jgi:radical SAM superfamily enzyme YgiQ (UPF0313 family)
VKIPWLAWYNEKNLTEEFMRRTLEAGSIGFTFSPDGFTDETMKGIGKNLTEKDVRKGYKLVKKIEKATASYNFFINPPGQDFRGFMKLVGFYIRTMVLNRKKFHGFTLAYPRIEPFTPLYRKAIEEGVISAKTDLLPEKSEDLYKLFYRNPSNWYIHAAFRVLVLLKKIKRKLFPVGG